jgi:16S rRNA (cytidine1402-2'-O)-methyltransferase
MSGTLFIVATPIGNLDDLSQRARQTLAEVDLIAAEDTRHTGRLLSHFGIKTPQYPLHDHNEKHVVSKLMEKLAQGMSIALVSDAGTPLVSDPGYRLVSAAHAQGIAVSPVPGASAVTTALSAAGLPTDRFCFEGFLPSKRAARRELLTRLVGEQRTLVFYESVHRIADSLADLADIFGRERPAFIGRELTKLHEQCVHASLGDLCESLLDGSIATKGEFVIVVAAAPTAEQSSVDIDRLLVELVEVLPGKQAAAIVAKVTNGKRNELYQRMLELTKPR